jgi:hypothetical protein
MSLPGSIIRINLHDTDKQTECFHPGCQAAGTYRFTAESDSAGDEFEYYCDVHIQPIQQSLQQADRSGFCEWCKRHVTLLSPRRDFEEGAHGQVYQVCQGCIHKQNSAIDAENAQLREDEGAFEPFDDSEDDLILDPDEFDDDDDGEPPII